MMLRSIFLVVTAFFYSICALAAPLDTEVESLLGSTKIRTADYAVYATLMPKDKVLIDINKDTSLNPASCLKLVTTAAALKYLGPDYRFPTEFYLTGNGAAPSLWVKGYGDPSFVIEKLEEAVTDMIRAGLPNRVGDIYIDDTYFDDKDYPGRQRGVRRSYNAYTGAVSLNHSALMVEVFPAERAGLPAIVTIDTPAIKVKNNAKTVAGRVRKGVSIKKVISKKEGEYFLVTGNISVNSPKQKMHYSIVDPTEHFGEALAGMLKQKGIMVDGAVKRARVSTGQAPFYVSHSKPLSEVIKDMNKHSSNFMAEQLTKVIGGRDAGAPATTEKGVAVFVKYLRSLGINNFSIENGSGLSRNNSLSVYDLYLVMKDIYKDLALRDVFIDSLSVAGVDGTLKKWDSPYLKNVLKAKTGSLNGVSTLAGFIPTDRGTVLFVIFMNGERVDFATGRKVSQRISELLAQKL